MYHEGSLAGGLTEERLPATEDLLLVLMAGGFGRRLGEITKKTPKPLVEINGEPIIQIILKQYASLGIRRVVITLHYLASQIREKLGDGSAFGLEIRYIEEKQPLGTAGALSLLGDDLPERILVSNADLLTDYNLEEMLWSHVRSNASLTVGVKEHVYTMPFGELQMDDDGCIRGIREKPEYKIKVSAGVYMMNREVISAHVPSGRAMDMPDLIQKVAETQEGRVNGFMLDGLWLDIGRPDDLERARQMNLGELVRCNSFKTRRSA